MITKAESLGSTLKQCLMDDEETMPLFKEDDLDRLDRPETYTGLASEMINRQIEKIKTMRKEDPSELQ